MEECTTGTEDEGGGVGKDALPTSGTKGCLRQERVGTTLPGWQVRPGSRG